jgi:hypothetical protein
MSRSHLWLLLTLLVLQSSPSAADEPSRPTPTASPATAEDLVDSFARREQLSGKNAAEFRRIVADARLSAQKLKEPTVDDKRRILKSTRQNVAKILDEKQLNDFDVLGWGLLLYRPSPGDENPMNFFKRLREEHSDRWFHALP